jgi:hypothetical protein
MGPLEDTNFPIFSIHSVTVRSVPNRSPQRFLVFSKISTAEGGDSKLRLTFNDLSAILCAIEPVIIIFSEHGRYKG